LLPPLLIKALKARRANYLWVLIIRCPVIFAVFHMIQWQQDGYAQIVI
jgi:hypothetical protein